MGLAYLFLFIMILGATGAAVVLLVLAWNCDKISTETRRDIDW